MSIDSDTARLIRKLAKIKDVEVPRGSSKAINLSSNKIKKRVVKAVSVRTKIPAKHVRRKVFIDRSTAKTQKAVFAVYRDDVSLISLLSRANINTRLQRSKRKRRPSIKWGGETFYDSFVAQPKDPDKSGKPHVFRRTSRIRTTYPGDRRHKYVLEAVKVPLKHEVDAVTPKIARRVMKNEYPKLFTHELEYRLLKYAKR